MREKEQHFPSVFLASHRRRWLILTALLAPLVFVLRLLAASPENPSPQYAAGQRMASLYVKNFFWPSTGLQSVEFVWIPAVLEPHCATMTFEACQLFGQSKKDLLRGIPRQVLSSKMTTEDKGLSSSITVLEDLKQFNLLPKTGRPDGAFSFEAISDAPRVNAQVFWENSPSGEVFRVLRIVKSTEPN